SCQHNGGVVSVGVGVVVGSSGDDTATNDGSKAKYERDSGGRLVGYALSHEEEEDRQSWCRR
ncbi:hypothetical protein U1Q18_004540, partial [Sarracenia purpurea var. burkii]